MTARSWKGRYIVPGLILRDALLQARVMARLDHPGTPLALMMTPQFREVSLDHTAVGYDVMVIGRDETTKS